MTSPALSPCPHISTTHLMGISLSNLLNMEAGAIQLLQGRLQGTNDVTSQDEEADVTQLITFGLQAAAQIIGALHQARARLPDAELRLPPYVDDAIADLALIFHWPLSELTALPLADLIVWREQARIRACPDE